MFSRDDEVDIIGEEGMKLRGLLSASWKLVIKGYIGGSGSDNEFPMEKDRFFSVDRLLMSFEKTDAKCLPIISAISRVSEKARLSNGVE